MKLSPNQGKKLVMTISNFNNYEDAYVELNNEISKFPDIDIYKVERTMENIEEREFVDLDIGKRWILQFMKKAEFSVLQVYRL